jgi:hypothetical protein
MLVASSACKWVILLRSNFKPVLIINDFPLYFSRLIKIRVNQKWKLFLGSMYLSLGVLVHFSGPCKKVAGRKALMHYLIHITMYWVHLMYCVSHSPAHCFHRIFKKSRKFLDAVVFMCLFAVTLISYNLFKFWSFLSLKFVFKQEFVKSLNFWASALPVI